MSDGVSGDGGRANPADAGAPGATAVIAFAAVVLLLFGFLRFGYFYFGDLAEGEKTRAAPLLINELTGAASTVAVFVLLIPFVRRFPLTRDPTTLRVRLPLHLLALLATSAITTTLLWVSRTALYPAFGLRPFDYGIMRLRYPMEGFNFVFTYVLLAGAIQFWLTQEEARRRELREARLAARWSEARLQSLQAQLHPHFLFNTLNTVSAVMYRSTEDADRVLSLLSDLLRLQLEASGQRVSIEEELETLRVYLQIMEARFTDRLTWRIDVEPGAAGAEVPGFLLQPMVENAIRHGIARRADAGRVEVRVARDGARLRITVDDDGPGPGPSPPEASGGLGIANTQERLRHLYGEAASFRLVEREPRGARAILEFPYRPAPVATEGKEANAGDAGDAAPLTGSPAAAAAGEGGEGGEDGAGSRGAGVTGAAGGVE